MTTITKRKRVINEKAEQGKFYDCTEALTLLKELPPCQFDQTVEANFNLGVDVRKSDQVIRGAIVLPNGTGRSVRIAVFAQGEQADAAKEAGEDIVGFDDLAASVKKGEINENSQTREDFFRWDYLEKKIEDLHSLLKIENLIIREMAYQPKEKIL